MKLIDRPRFIRMLRAWEGHPIAWVARSDMTVAPCSLSNHHALTGCAWTSEVRSRYCGLLTWCGRYRTLFPSQRPDGEKFVSARVATQPRQSQDPSKRRSRARHMLSGDALQLQVAAIRAMGVKQNAKRQEPRAKSRPASFAAPRQDACGAEQKVPHRSALGTPDVRSVARRAANGCGPDRLSPRQE